MKRDVKTLLLFTELSHYCFCFVYCFTRACWIFCFWDSGLVKNFWFNFLPCGWILKGERDANVRYIRIHQGSQDRVDWDEVEIFQNWTPETKVVPGRETEKERKRERENEGEGKTVKEKTDGTGGPVNHMGLKGARNCQESRRARIE